MSLVKVFFVVNFTSQMRRWASSLNSGRGMTIYLLLKHQTLPPFYSRKVPFGISALSSINVATQAMHAPSSLIDDFTSCCYRKDLPRAIRAMNSLEELGIQADSVTYVELIKCCIQHRAVEQGRLVHQHIFSSNQFPEMFLVNNLLNMYVKFGLLNDARQLFDNMPQRNVVSWTTMISASANGNCERDALRLLIAMCREGVSPNGFTYSSVLRACDGMETMRQLHGSIIKFGLSLDVFVRSSLIDSYSKWGGDLQSGAKIFEEMATDDLVLWNSIIGAFAQNGEGEIALDIFKQMRGVGLFANQGSLTSVLRACTGSVMLELGKQVHCQVFKFGRDLILDNALLDMYSKCGSLEEATLTFKRMEDKDVISWSTMVAGLAQNGRSLAALELFKSMVALGQKPNYITMVGVLFACSHAGLIEDGWMHFKSMSKNYGIQPGREHVGCMVDLLGRAGKIDEAISFIENSEYNPDSVIWRSLLNACRVHKNVKLAGYVADKLLELEPADVGALVLLSNVYADYKRWGDVEKVRKAMRERGVSKNPGCSWIEIEKRIHCFIFGDNSHPEISQIRLELTRLINRVFEFGYVPDTNFVLMDLEGEQKEFSLHYHSEKLAIAFALMKLSKEKHIRIMKNLRICGDCHTFAKFVSRSERQCIVIRDPIRFHHFIDGDCSCGDYW